MIPTCSWGIQGCCECSWKPLEGSHLSFSGCVPAWLYVAVAPWHSEKMEGEPAPSFDQFSMFLKESQGRRGHLSETGAIWTLLLSWVFITPALALLFFRSPRRLVYSEPFSDLLCQRACFLVPRISIPGRVKEQVMCSGLSFSFTASGGILLACQDFLSHPLCLPPLLPEEGFISTSSRGLRSLVIILTSDSLYQK